MTSPGAPDPSSMMTGSFQPAVDPRAELAKRALVPIVENVGPRCPRCGARLLTESSKQCPRCKVDPSSAEAGALLIPPGTWKQELWRGASYVPRGFWRVFTTPRLWPVAAVPLLINIAVFVTVWLLTYFVLQDWLIKQTDSNAHPDWTGFWWGTLQYILTMLGVIARAAAFILIPLVTAWLMSAFPFAVVFRAIFAPFATMVGERTEQIVLDLPEAKEPFDFGRLQASLVLSIVDSILLAIVQGFLYLVLLPINIVPLVGQFVWMLLPPSIMASMDHTDPTLCRKNYYTREKVALWKLRKWRFLGFGLTFFFLLGVPFVNAVMFPVVAAGAALLYVELDRK